MTAHVLTGLPARWRTDRMLCAEREHWDGVRWTGDDDALLLVVSSHRRPGVSLLGRGDGALVDRLVAELVATRLTDARWMSLPRTARPSRAVLDALGLVPFSTWDWLSADAAPPVLDGEARVRRLEPVRESDAIRACLAAANPQTSADPTAPGEVGWWGVDGRTELAGVVGVSVRAGISEGVSWHLHGLAVRDEYRGAGLGTALTAACTRAGLTRGAEWVSLGMYASNDPARRIYHRLGYRTEAEFASFSPPDADRPPA